MKKVLAIAAFASLALMSCKKDYTCECTIGSGATAISASTTINDTKKKATDACEAGSASLLGITTTCKIK
jgi:hypothetical protein